MKKNGKWRTVRVNHILRDCINEICARLSLEVNSNITAPKLIYLVVFLYESNPDKFIKHFSRLAKKCNASLKQISKRGYEYVLKMDRIIEIAKEKGIPYTELSKKVWGSKTSVYKYINGKSMRVNKTIVKNLVEVLGTTVDEIAEFKKYLDL